MARRVHPQSRDSRPDLFPLSAAGEQNGPDRPGGLSAAGPHVLPAELQPRHVGAAAPRAVGGVRVWRRPLARDAALPRGRRVFVARRRHGRARRARTPAVFRDFGEGRDQRRRRLRVHLPPRVHPEVHV
ncbi:MAG: hypothetical protein BJ554DRAFT_4720 [Olpidium bornovanus]|uniref:Uncharacterized protein n=1 Tax=Olpidium bornovanus TaxID=278681 RepID=A0A8H8DEW7_9FUNG|nr:MAG: hypothetical protein BJ554DRAFT_4720 [Olpidium bornovanus]